MSTETARTIRVGDQGLRRAQWLLGALEEAGGPLPAVSLLADGLDQEGFTASQLSRARRRLGVTSARFGGSGFWWCLPREARIDIQDDESGDQGLDVSTGVER